MAEALYINLSTRSPIHLILHIAARVIFVCLCVAFFEIGSHCVLKAGLSFILSIAGITDTCHSVRWSFCLSFPKCWDYKCVPPCPAQNDPFKTNFINTLLILLHWLPFLLRLESQVCCLWSSLCQFPACEPPTVLYYTNCCHSSPPSVSAQIARAGGPC